MKVEITQSEYNTEDYREQLVYIVCFPIFSMMNLDIFHFPEENKTVL